MLQKYIINPIKTTILTLNYYYITGLYYISYTQ